MTSTNDGKDVKSNTTSGPKGKSYYIELYKSLEAALSSTAGLSERCEVLCRAWGRVHCLCVHSAPSTHPHLLAWLQRHTARTLLQTEWQSPTSAAEHQNLKDAIDSFISETSAAVEARGGAQHSWETMLVLRGEWFKKTLADPWGHPVLRRLLDPGQPQPDQPEILEWLREERGVMFVTRLRQLAASKCDDLALSLATAVMDRARATEEDEDVAAHVTDKPPEPGGLNRFGTILKVEAGFTTDVWELLADIEYVLLHKLDRTNRCIELAKQAPLRSSYQLVERLRTRLETSPKEKKLWKNAKDVATLIAQVIIARCMVSEVCADVSRGALYCCSRSLVRLLPPERLPAAAAALAAPAATSKHLHTLATAVEAQCKEEMKPFVCELYVRAITAGMNELERLKLKTEKEAEAHIAEQTLSTWFLQLGSLLSASGRINCECVLTAFSVHPSPGMYERLRNAPPLLPIVDLKKEPKLEPSSDFGSWANDSRSHTNFVKTSEYLNLKSNDEHQCNVLSTAILTEGETLGLSPELCQDLAVLLSGPRVKTLSWDMDRDKLLENCRVYMERTRGGTRTLTKELKYLNLDLNQFKHLPEEDEGEDDIYYGIEKGYEHLVELPTPEPEEIWADAITDYERTSSACSSAMEDMYVDKTGRKKKKKHYWSDDSDPLSLHAEQNHKEKSKKDRPQSKERSKHKHKSKTGSREASVSRERRKERSNSKEKTHKKEKKERKKVEKLQTDSDGPKPPGSLANLIGLKVCVPTVEDEKLTAIQSEVKKQKRKPKVPKKKKNSLTDSDYDSQGKSSLASLTSADTEKETDVLFDGLFSMDDFKMSPPKSVKGSPPPTYSKVESNLVQNELSFSNGAVTNNAHLQNSPMILNKSEINPLLPVAQQLPVQERSEMTTPVPQENSHVSYGNTASDDIRQQLSKLLYFRKQKSSPIAQSPSQGSTFNPTNDLPRQQEVTYDNKKPVIFKFIPQKNMTGEGSTVSPIDFIKSHYPHLQLNMINKSQTTKTSEVSAGVIRPFKTYTTSEPVTSPITYSSSLQPITSGTTVIKSKQNLPVSHPSTNYATKEQIPTRLNKILGMSDFLNDLQAKTDETKQELSVRRTSKDAHSTSVMPSAFVPDIIIKKSSPMSVRPNLILSPQSAKQIIQQKKVENAPNTFSRLSYLHKNKQVDSKVPQNAEAVQRQLTEREQISNEVERHINEVKFQQLQRLQNQGNITVSKIDKHVQNAMATNEIQRLKLEQNMPAFSDVTSDNPVSSGILMSSNQSNASTMTAMSYDRLNQLRIPTPSTITSKTQSLFTKNELYNLVQQKNKLNAQNFSFQQHYPKNVSNNFTEPISKFTSVAAGTSLSRAVMNPQRNVQYPSTTSTPSSNEAMPISQFNNDLIGTPDGNFKTVPSSSLVTNLSNSSNIQATKPSKILKIPVKKTNKMSENTEKPDKLKKELDNVMSAILARKTPNRGPNALDIALNKNQEEAMSFLRTQRIPKAMPEVKLEINMDSIASNKTKCEKIQHAARTQPYSRHNKQPHQQDPTVINSFPSQNNINQKQKPSVILMPAKTSKKQNKHSASKSVQNQNKKNKQVVQPSNSKRLENINPLNIPLITPNADEYAMLDELMDMDLLKEIGELSDEEEPKLPELAPASNVNNQMPSTNPNSSEQTFQHHGVQDNQNATQPIDSYIGMRIENLENVGSFKVDPIAKSKTVIGLAKNIILKPKLDKLVHKIRDPMATQEQQSTSHFNISNSNIVINSSVINADNPTILITSVPVVQPSVVLVRPAIISSKAVQIQETQIYPPHFNFDQNNVSVNTPNIALYQTTRYATSAVNQCIVGNPMKNINDKSLVNCNNSNIDQNVTNNTINSETMTSYVNEMALNEPKINGQMPNLTYQSDKQIPKQTNIIDYNENVDRKILSEVQQKITANLEKPESKCTEENLKIETNLDNSIENLKYSTEDMKRITNKRSAILNRQISKQPAYGPIVLTYEPLQNDISKMKKIRKSKNKSKAAISNDNNVNLSNKDDIEEQVSLMVEKIKYSCSNEIQAKDKKIDVSQESPDGGSKENDSTAKTRRILLRSSNKLEENTLLEKETKNITKIKTKVRLKSTSKNKQKPKQKILDKNMDKVVSGKNIKLSEEKDSVLTPTRASQRISSKNSSINKSNEKKKDNEIKENPANDKKVVTKNIIEAFDIESELVGSKIAKDKATFAVSHTPQAVINEPIDIEAKLLGSIIPSKKMEPIPKMTIKKVMASENPEHKIERSSRIDHKETTANKEISMETSGSTKILSEAARVSVKMATPSLAVKQVIETTVENIPNNSSNLFTENSHVQIEEKSKEPIFPSDEVVEVEPMETSLAVKQIIETTVVNIPNNSSNLFTENSYVQIEEKSKEPIFPSEEVIEVEPMDTSLAVKQTIESTVGNIPNNSSNLFTENSYVQIEEKSKEPIRPSDEVIEIEPIDIFHDETPAKTLTTHEKELRKDNSVEIESGKIQADESKDNIQNITTKTKTIPENAAVMPDLKLHDTRIIVDKIPLIEDIPLFDMEVEDDPVVKTKSQKLSDGNLLMDSVPPVTITPSKYAKKLEKTECDEIKTNQSDTSKQESEKIVASRVENYFTTNDPVKPSKLSTNVIPEQKVTDLTEKMSKNNITIDSIAVNSGLAVIDTKSAENSSIKTCDLTKDEITITHLYDIPAGKGQPAKKCVRVCLPNNKTYKMTVFCSNEVDFKSLIDNPQIKSLLNRIDTSGGSYKLSIPDASCHLKGTTVSSNVVDTIDLVSDEEVKEAETISFKTEFGIYKVSAEHFEYLESHQNKFDQKCMVKLIKQPDSFFIRHNKSVNLDTCSDVVEECIEISESDQETDKASENSVYKEVINQQLFSDQTQHLLDSHAKKQELLPVKAKEIDDVKSTAPLVQIIPEIIELGDSSDDECQPIIQIDADALPKQPEGKLDELTNMLLCDFGVVVKEKPIPPNVKSQIVDDKLQRKCLVKLVRCDELVKRYEDEVQEILLAASNNIFSELCNNGSPENVEDPEDVIVLSDNEVTVDISSSTPTRRSGSPSILSYFDTEIQVKDCELFDLDLPSEDSVSTDGRTSPVIAVFEVIAAAHAIKSKTINDKLLLKCEADWLTTKPCFTFIEKENRSDAKIQTKFTVSSLISTVLKFIDENDLVKQLKPLNYKHITKKAPISSSSYKVKAVVISTQNLKRKNSLGIDISISNKLLKRNNETVLNHTEMVHEYDPTSLSDIKSTHSQSYSKQGLSETSKKYKLPMICINNEQILKKDKLSSEECSISETKVRDSVVDTRQAELRKHDIGLNGAVFINDGSQVNEESENNIEFAENNEVKTVPEAIQSQELVTDYKVKETNVIETTEMDADKTLINSAVKMEDFETKTIEQASEVTSTKNFNPNQNAFLAHHFGDSNRNKVLGDPYNTKMEDVPTKENCDKAKKSTCFKNEDHVDKEQQTTDTTVGLTSYTKEWKSDNIMDCLDKEVREAAIKNDQSGITIDDSLLTKEPFCSTSASESSFHDAINDEIFTNTNKGKQKDILIVAYNDDIETDFVVAENIVTDGSEESEYATANNSFEMENVVKDMTTNSTETTKNDFLNKNKQLLLESSQLKKSLNLKEQVAQEVSVSANLDVENSNSYFIDLENDKLLSIEAQREISSDSKNPTDTSHSFFASVSVDVENFDSNAANNVGLEDIKMRTEEQITSCTKDSTSDPCEEQNQCTILHENDAENIKCDNYTDTKYLTLDSNSEENVFGGFSVSVSADIEEVDSISCFSENTDIVNNESMSSDDMAAKNITGVEFVNDETSHESMVKGSELIQSDNDLIPRLCDKKSVLERQISKETITLENSNERDTSLTSVATIVSRKEETPIHNIKQKDDISNIEVVSDTYLHPLIENSANNGNIVRCPLAVDQPGIILKGMEINDPRVGTCYIFQPIDDSASETASVKTNDSEALNDSNDSIFEVANGESFDVRSPAVDTISVASPLIYTAETNTIPIEDKFDSIEHTEVCRAFDISQPKRIYKIKKILKRKIGMKDITFRSKKVRKAKNIDYPKQSKISITELSFATQFDQILKYIKTVDFSYSLSYHKQSVNVDEVFENWPLAGPVTANYEQNSMEPMGRELFYDLDQSGLDQKLNDPLNQSLVEEMSAVIEDVDIPCAEDNVTNFNMGFGEGSGRVIQNLKRGGDISKFSAATLSDVKQSQPFLLSEDNKDYENDNSKLHCNQKQIEQLKRYLSFIQLKEKVRSFFDKIKVELRINPKEEIKELNGENKVCRILRNVPGLYGTDFIKPTPSVPFVQVVQVGQLPVSAAAQNPVTCDPRVTQVSDASPSQCSVESSPRSDNNQANIKAEYTELTNADLNLPLVQDLSNENQSTTPKSQENNLTEQHVIPKEVEIRGERKERIKNRGKDSSMTDNQESMDYQFDPSRNSDTINQLTTEQLMFNNQSNPSNQSNDTENYLNKQENGTMEKTNQIAHAMNAAGITTTPEIIATTTSTHPLVNILTQKMQMKSVSTGQTTTINSYPKTSINAMALQQALASILPPPLNQTGSGNNNQNSNTGLAPQVLHIVQGKNATGNQITLVDNTQQSVISTPNATQVLHIVQNKSAAGATSNGTPAGTTNSFSGLSLVDTGLQKGGNQLLHIVNTGNQNNTNAGQLLKRVNLLTNLTNVQGGSEQKVVQFVCKSADGKSIHLNAPHQRSMVLRLQPIETPPLPPTPKLAEAQDLTSPSQNSSNSLAGKDTASQQEIKSRSVYEENYAKFIQNSSTKSSASTEKSTSLPKFNQAFGKAVFQDGTQKQNEVNTNLSSVHSVDGAECPQSDNTINLEHISQISSPPLLLRKTSAPSSQAQQNLVQQIKQTIAPMNIQTMHGGVIYTRQIPVNIGGGQTINLITVPSTELVDDSAQKQTADVKFISQNDMEPSIIKIVPQSQSSNESNTDENSHLNVSNENQATPQHQPVLTQMRIKLPMLSKQPQVLPGTRVVRPSFFQIQRNIVGGANQPVYQQLVLTAAPPLGQQTIRLPQAQTRPAKVETPSPATSESQLSSSTLEQLREFDMVLEQVKERSTVSNSSPNASSTNTFTNKIPTHSSDTTDSPIPVSTSANVITTSRSDFSTTQSIFSIGNSSTMNVSYVNRKSTVTTPVTSTYVRSPDSSGIADSPSSSSSTLPSVVSEPQVSSENSAPKTAAKIGSKSVKSRPSKPPSTHAPSIAKVNHIPPKTSTQKPLEDEQTTQRILYILAEYKEQVENSPDKDKPAPRRRSNPPSNPGGSSKRKKSSSGSRRPGCTRDHSPIDGADGCRTMGSEDSSCGTSQGDCTESCSIDAHSPQDSPRKVARKLTFEQETPTPIVAQPRVQPARNVIVADGQTITVARTTTGKPTTAVLMPANYILPVSMVKGGQQIAIVTNRGPKLLTVGGPGESGTANALLLQRLIGPAGLKPVLARPGVRHVRLPAAALHNLQAFNLAAASNPVQPPDSTASPVSAPTPPELVDTRATSSPWDSREPAAEIKPEPSPEASSPWHLQSSDPQDYSYQEPVTPRANTVDRTVLDPIPDRYSPDMEAQRIFDKMFEVDAKKSYGHDDSPRVSHGYDSHSDCDEKSYHQVVHKKDGSSHALHRVGHISTAALRHKYAILEHELRLQKSLSEECEDLGVDSPSASELFPEAELLFAASPAAHEHSHDHHHHHQHHGHTPQPALSQSSIPQPDMDDQIATDHLLPVPRHLHSQDGLKQELNDVNLTGLEDVGIVTVSEDGMQATIQLDQEEFARSHPNTTFHSEPTDEGEEVQPFTLSSGIKARHITQTIFHSNSAPATVLMTAPPQTVISQATAETSGLHNNNIKYDNMIHTVTGSHSNPNVNLTSVLAKDEGLTRFDSILTDSRELHLSNTASAIVHSGHATQVIRRVCYEDVKRDDRFLMDDQDAIIAGDDAKMVAEDSSRDATLESIGGDADDDRSSPERHAELFWESNSASERSESRRPLDFSSDSDKCCKSPSLDETNSTDSSGVGTHLRLDSVIKEARGRERSGSVEGSSADDTVHPPIRTYPPKRSFHTEGDVERSLSGKTRAGERSPDSPEVRRRASNRGVVKRGCHCCNGSPTPPRPKKPRQRKPALDFNHSN